MFPGKLKQMPAIKTAMTPFPYSIEVSEPLEAGVKMMAEHRIRHLPVTEDSVLVGVLSERDLNKPTDTGDASRLASRLVGEVCGREIFVVGLDRRLDAVLLEMAQRQVDAVVVLKEDRLAGIFTTSDACRCFGEHLRNLFPLPGGDIAA